MIAWLTGIMTTQRLITSLHAVAQASAPGEPTVAANVKTAHACSARAEPISALRPTASLQPLRAGTKRSWMTLTPPAIHFYLYFIGV